MEWPPSSNGVACFAPDGSIVDVLTWAEGAGFIADCYALTPAGSDAWASPYTDFPLVDFAPGEPTKWWRNELAGAKAIAADGNHMLLAGGYGSNAARLPWSNGTSEEVAKRRPRWRHGGCRYRSPVRKGPCFGPAAVTPRT